jgi:predicted glutamine amidotransferase
MCRWNAYVGQTVAIDELLFNTAHGLIDQSLHARMGVETTNGDGFGLGWYATNGARPGRYRGITPAWSDVNLRDLAASVESPLFLAHIRATTGTPVQQTNCHPFRQGRCERLWAIRYSTEHQSRTRFVSEHADALRKLHPDNPRIQRGPDEQRPFNPHWQ